jgi:ribosomal protein L35AE/L33A
VSGNFFFRQVIIKDGVFAKGTVETVEGYKGGVLITFAYSFNGKPFSGRVGIALWQE